MNQVMCARCGADSTERRVLLVKGRRLCARCRRVNPKPVAVTCPPIRYGLVCPYATELDGALEPMALPVDRRQVVSDPDLTRSEDVAQVESTEATHLGGHSL